MTNYFVKILVPVVKVSGCSFVCGALVISKRGTTQDAATHCSQKFPFFPVTFSSVNIFKIGACTSEYLYTNPEAL